MRVRLIRDSKVLIKAGETVDVSPEAYIYLTSTGSAVPVAEKTAKKTGKKNESADCRAVS